MDCAVSEECMRIEMYEWKRGEVCEMCEMCDM